MDNLLDVLLNIVQVLGLVLAVSVVTSTLLLLYLMIGAKIYKRMHENETYEEAYPIGFNEKLEDIDAIEDIDDIKNYLIKQAEYEKFYRQIEEYRNDFS